MSILLEIPLVAVPNQKVTCQLNNQNITFVLRTQAEELYCDVYLGATMIITGMRCVHGGYINQYTTPLVGNIFFWCENGLDPVYTELGSTAHLLYADYDYLLNAYNNWVAANG